MKKPDDKKKAEDAGKKKADEDEAKKKTDDELKAMKETEDKRKEYLTNHLTKRLFMLAQAESS